MSRSVLVRGELLDGLDVDGNAQVIIPYSPQTEAPHGRVRFVDPAAIVEDRDHKPAALRLHDKPIRCSAVEPGRLGWIDSGEGWWTHRITGARYLTAPGQRFVILVPPWVGDAAIKEMARWGGIGAQPPTEPTRR